MMMLLMSQSMPPSKGLAGSVVGPAGHSAAMHLLNFTLIVYRGAWGGEQARRGRLRSRRARLRTSAAKPVLSLVCEPHERNKKNLLNTDSPFHNLLKPLPRVFFSFGCFVVFPLFFRFSTFFSFYHHFFIFSPTFSFFEQY